MIYNVNKFIQDKGKGNKEPSTSIDMTKGDKAVKDLLDIAIKHGFSVTMVIKNNCLKHAIINYENDVHSVIYTISLKEE